MKKRKKVPVPKVDWVKAVKKSLEVGKQKNLALIYFHINKAAILLREFLPKK